MHDTTTINVTAERPCPVASETCISETTDLAAQGADTALFGLTLIAVGWAATVFAAAAYAAATTHR